MSSLALRRGPGFACADLPPTLQPHAIAVSVPRPDHLRNLGLSGVIYALIGGTVVLLSTVTTRVIPQAIPPTRPTRLVEFDGVLRPVAPRLLPTVSGGRGPGLPSGPTVAATAPSPDPVEAAAGLSLEDRRNQAPVGEGTGGANPAPAPSGTGAGAGPAIQDLGHSGLAVLKQVEPTYPDFARKAHLQGAVVLHLVVDESGQPIRVEVLDGHPAFHQVAVQAARQWRFEPARIEGRPVSASFRLTLKFLLR